VRFAGGEGFVGFERRARRCEVMLPRDVDGGREGSEGVTRPYFLSKWESAKWSKFSIHGRRYGPRVEYTLTHLIPPRR
jgi:hypothetical protein